MGSRTRIVICGGGAIAYFISLRGAWPIVIERYRLAARHPASRAVIWRWTGLMAALWFAWPGVASHFTPDFPPTSAIPGDIDG
jgi:hypothetical protein